MPPSKRPPKGVEFPVSAKGDRSTTAINQSTFAAAVRAASPSAAEAVEKQRGWRFGYAKHLVKQVEIAAHSPENAINIAKAGLKHLHSSFEFIRDGKTLSVTEAMTTLTKGSFETGFLKGSAKKPATFEYEVPYHGRVLKGDELRVQIDKWVRDGVIELSTGASLTKVSNTSEWLDMSDKYVVLLGASSAMGPLPLLLSLGAHVIAIDLDRAPIWAKIIGMARESCGTLTFPLKKPQSQCKNDEELFSNAGCDLLCDTPEIRNWLLSVHSGKQLTVGAYAYLDGPLFVRVSMAMDAIVQDLVKKRQASIAYLCTPTDVHLVPASAMAVAASNHRRAPLWQQLFAALVSCTSQKMSRNVRKPVVTHDGSEQRVMDSVVLMQGPNYILAKRLQHWRAVVSREQGSVVSSNIAPSSATASVLSKFSIKVALLGMKYFKPVEIFMQDTSNAVMGGLLINDLSNEQSASHPGVALRNPMNLFTENSFHGGAWRVGWKFSCIGPASVMAYLTVNYLVTAYLFLYNALQAVGWGMALLSAVMHIAGSSSSSMWAVVGSNIHWFTMLTCMEVVHSMTGMVSAPVFTTAIQVWSRVMVAAVVQECAATQDVKPWLYMMVLAWSLTEVVRYSFYALNLVNIKVGILTWLRYTLFIVLYPTGVAGEIGVLFTANSADMLGGLPITASTPWLVQWIIVPFFKMVPLWLLVIGYLLGLPLLYGHLLKQRSKVVGGRGAGAKLKKA